MPANKSNVPELLIAIARAAEAKGAFLPRNAVLATALGVKTAAISTHMCALVEAGDLQLTSAGHWRRLVRVIRSAAVRDV